MLKTGATEPVCGSAVATEQSKVKDGHTPRHDRMDTANTACIFDGDSIRSGTQFGNEGTARWRLFDTKRTTTVALARFVRGEG